MAYGAIVDFKYINLSQIYNFVIIRTRNWGFECQLATRSTTAPPSTLLKRFTTPEAWLEHGPTPHEKRHWTTPAQRWASVQDAGPPLSQHWASTPVYGMSDVNLWSGHYQRFVPRTCSIEQKKMLLLDHQLLSLVVQCEAKCSYCLHKKWIVTGFRFWTSLVSGVGLLIGGVWCR